MNRSFGDDELARGDQFVVSLKDRLDAQADGVDAPADFVERVTQRRRIIARRRIVERVAMASAAAIVAIAGFAVVSSLSSVETRTDAAASLDQAGHTSEPNQAEKTEAALNADVAIWMNEPRWSRSRNADDPPVCDPEPYEVVVWIDPEATETEVLEVDALLAEAEWLDSYDYVDKSETWKEFSWHYRDQPEVLELISAEQMPTSFIVIVDREQGNSFERAMWQFPIVSDVQGDDQAACASKEQATDRTSVLIGAPILAVVSVVGLAWRRFRQPKNAAAVGPVAAANGGD